LLEYAVLVFVGYGSISFNSMAKSALQLSAAPAMRGRVMSLWAVAWLGSTPIGGPLVGWIGEELGARWSLIIGGIPTIIVGIAAYPVLARVDRKRAEGRAEAAVARQAGEAAAPAASPQGSGPGKAALARATPDS
jgi:MFS family permease